MHPPLEIKRLSEAQLSVRWSDGRHDVIESEFLRRNCPCASCLQHRGELDHDKPLSPLPVKKSMLQVVSNSLQEETKLVEVWGIGNYALGCRWADGHATGIYTFAKLRSIAEQQAGISRNAGE